VVGVFADPRPVRGPKRNIGQLSGVRPFRIEMSAVTAVAPGVEVRYLTRVQLTCWRCGLNFRAISQLDQRELNKWLNKVKELRTVESITLSEALQRMDTRAAIRSATGLHAESDVMGDTRLRVETPRGPMFRCPACGGRFRAPVA
jgi:hypothetical protein